MSNVNINNIVFSSRNIDDLITDIAIEVVKRIEINSEALATSSNATDKWFNLDELCYYLPDKPKKATVYSWISCNSIPVHKGSKKLRFLRSEIDNWLKQGRDKTLCEISYEVDKVRKKKGVNHA